MPHIERTDQGEQYVLPGTERRTAPGLPYAAEADGQLTLHFYAPPDKSERRPRPTSARALSSTPLPVTALPTGAAMAPAMAQAPAAADSAPQSLFGRRLAHFPRVFDQP
ncbi:hypothetical protein SAMN02982917_0251 [Azospirillum oryzae]|uniref:Uncharacterized protein n=1 Tax=Azospirillum oryzae TaxID=286727 RepID=A0A1X7HRH8_9PROT|nr:hypothetical protein [Azospirillum oryzae]SMF91477.1 hypothetical protein SAMN02982917_0251 [Azospirillum oryzae]